MSRNVHFITGLMEHRVHSIVAAFGRDCDQFVLHIYTSLAEQERKLISERCKAAAAVRKLRGRQIGFQMLSKAKRRRIQTLAWAASAKAADERAEAFRPHIEWALRQPGLRGKRITFECAADKLNERNIKGSMDGVWTGAQVQSMAIRLGIYHPHHVRLEVARAAVRAILKHHPEFSARKVQAIARLERPLGYNRTYKLLTQFRPASVVASLQDRRY